MMGREFSFQFDTLTKKFQTPLGGSATVILLLISVATFFVIFSQLFESDAPVVTSSIEFGSQEVEHDLYQQKIFNTFSLSNQGRLIPVEEIPRFVSMKVNIHVFSQNKTSGLMQPINKHIYDLIPCTQLQDPHHLGPAKVMLPGHTLGIALCIDFSSDPNFEHYSIKNSPKESYFQEVYIHVFPCSLPDKTKCASPQEIGTTMFVMTRIDNYVVSTDKENPLRTIGDRYTSMLDLYNTKYKVLTVKEHKVIDDASLFAEPTLKLEFASPELASSDTSSRSPMISSCDAADVEALNYGKCQQYLEFTYGAVPQLMVMRRSYKKLTGVMGEFGGVLKIFSSVIFFVYSIYSSRAIKKFFRKRLLESSQAGPHLGGQVVEEFIKSLGKTKVGGDDNQKGKPGPIKDNKGKQLAKEMDEALTDLVKSRLNAVNILKQLSVLEVLQEALFTEEESELLPLALLNLRRKRLAAQKNNKPESPSNQQTLNAARRRLHFTNLEDKAAGKRTSKIQKHKNQLRKLEVEVKDLEGFGKEKEEPVGSLAHFQQLYKKLKTERAKNLVGGHHDHRDHQNQIGFLSLKSSNPIQEFIFANVTELFSDQEEEKDDINEPPTAQKVINMKECLKSSNQDDLDREDRSQQPPKTVERSFEVKDLEIPEPGKIHSEYSIMSPLKSPPARAKRRSRKKSFKKKKSAISSELGRVNEEPQLGKKSSDLSENTNIYMKKSSKAGLRRKNKSKSSLKSHLD